MHANLPPTCARTEPRERKKKEAHHRSRKKKIRGRAGQQGARDCAGDDRRKRPGAAGKSRGRSPDPGDPRIRSPDRWGPTDSGGFLFARSPSLGSLSRSRRIWPALIFLPLLLLSSPPPPPCSRIRGACPALPCIYTPARRGQHQTKPNRETSHQEEKEELIHPSCPALREILLLLLRNYYYGSSDRFHGCGCSHPGSGGHDPASGAEGVLPQGRRPQGGAGPCHGGRRGRPGAGDARAGRRRQRRRPRRHRQDPPQLQIQSDHGGIRDARAGAAGPGPHHEREHDHHRLLDAGDDRLRAAQARQGVVRAPGDPRGDHVLRERAHPDHALHGGGRRGLPAQARPALGRLAPLQPHDPMILQLPRANQD